MVLVREAPGGFEPPIRVLQTPALPLGYGAGLHRYGFYHSIPDFRRIAAGFQSFRRDDIGSTIQARSGSCGTSFFATTRVERE